VKEDQASFTAMTVAYVRAYHSIHATQKIFDDFLAYELIPKENSRLNIKLFPENNKKPWWKFW
jgi:O-methyltransferase involved in polyketide biosynthesis